MKIKWIGIFVLSAVIIVGAFIFQDKLIQFRSLGLFGIFLTNLIGSATIYLPAPAIVTVIAGGIVYPPLFVSVVATLGAALGDMISYVLGVSGRKVFLKKEYVFYAKLTRFMMRYGSLTIVVFAFLPNPFFDAIGIAAGALGYSPYKFFLWVFMGRLARNILLAFFGAQF